MPEYSKRPVEELHTHSSWCGGAAAPKQHTTPPMPMPPPAAVYRSIPEQLQIGRLKRGAAPTASIPPVPSPEAVVLNMRRVGA
jgi:hypothetical protein